MAELFVEFLMWVFILLAAIGLVGMLVSTVVEYTQRRRK